jgi:hypothetical protein
LNHSEKARKHFEAFFVCHELRRNSIQDTLGEQIISAYSDRPNFGAVSALNPKPDSMAMSAFLRP